MHNCHFHTPANLQTEVSLKKTKRKTAMPIKGTSTIKTNSMQRHNKLQTILFKPVLHKVVHTTHLSLLTPGKSPEIIAMTAIRYM